MRICGRIEFDRRAAKGFDPLRGLSLGQHHLAGAHFVSESVLQKQVSWNHEF